METVYYFSEGVSPPLGNEVEQRRDKALDETRHLTPVHCDTNKGLTRSSPEQVKLRTRTLKGLRYPRSDPIGRPPTLCAPGLWWTVHLLCVESDSTVAWVLRTPHVTIDQTFRRHKTPSNNPP